MNYEESILTIFHEELRPDAVVRIGIQSGTKNNTYNYKNGIITHRSLDSTVIKVAYHWAESEADYIHHPITVQNILDGYYKVKLLLKSGVSFVE